MRSVKYIFLFVLFGIAVIYAQIGPVSENVRLKVDKETFDFGDVAADTKIEHTFKITNVGTDTLKIYKVKSS